MIPAAPPLQALIQDFVLRWRMGGGGADDDIDGPPSLGERVGSLARRASSGGSRAAERVASLAKLGGGQAPVEGERQASLLGPLHLRSDAV